MDIAPRTLTIEDILAIQHLDGIWTPAVDLAPAGDQLAVVINQGCANRDCATIPFLMGMDLGQLHLIDLASGEVLRVPPPDGKGLAAPLYSPSGQRVAVVAASVDGVVLGVVNVESLAVQFYPAHQLAIEPQRQPPFQWLDDDTLVCQVLPAGQRPWNLDVTLHVRDTTAAVWKRALGNRLATASPLHIVEESAGLGEPVLVSVQAHGLMPLVPEDSHNAAIAAFHARPPANKIDERAMAEHNAAVRVVWEGRGRVVSSWRSNHGNEVRWVEGDEPARCLLKFNTHLQDVHTGEVLDLPYTLADGQPRQLRCILPPDHVPGIPRPAVMFVYPRLRYSLPADAHRLIEGPHLVDNAHLFAAQGYVVIEPNLPFDGEAGGEYIDALGRAVAPALEAAAQAGLIDRDRVHVFGQSAGGWAVMALLATTDYFRSGISMAGIADVAAYDTQPDVRFRYQPSQASAFHGARMGARLLGIEQAPWQTPQRYVHNSPLYRVAAIDTPLLLMHGDLDYVHMGQSEAMFMAMKAEGKAVEFVRYWGEDHLYCSAANGRDAFERINAWLTAHNA